LNCDFVAKKGNGVGFMRLEFLGIRGWARFAPLGANSLCLNQNYYKNIKTPIYKFFTKCAVILISQNLGIYRIG
jgi:hypothetical protein